MSARRVCAITLACAIALATLPAGAAPALKVCADPADLPFSDAAGAGFENRIAALVAEELHRPLQFVWRMQRRGFLREGLNSGACDLVTAEPLGAGGVATTLPYYRSTYVFVTRPGEPRVGSVDDAALPGRLIGVQLIGDNGVNSPPAHLLTRRGLVANVRGYSVYGDGRDPSSARRIIDAVQAHEIDVAAVWGPVAGYFAAQERPPLVVTPMAQPEDVPIPVAFDIAMAVRRTDRDLLSEVNRALETLKPRIQGVLRDFAVPVLPD